MAAIATKRTPLPETRFLDREDITALFAQLPQEGRHARRDRALSLMLYNTGARVQEIADLRLEHVSLTSPLHVRLTAKGTNAVPVRCGRRRRACFAGSSTSGVSPIPRRRCSHRRRAAPERASASTNAVRQHAARLESAATSPTRRITPHVFRHAAAVHFLEAGVEVNVIRGWLGHVSLETTKRYAEITMRIQRGGHEAV